MSAPNASSPFTGPASPEHLAQIAVAKQLFKPVRRAVLVSASSAWTTAIFAVITVLGSLNSLPELALGVGMSIVATVEFRVGGALKRLQTSAPPRLALNQLAFAALLIGYGAYKLMTIQKSAIADIDPQLSEMIGDIEGLTMQIEKLVYASVLIAAVVGPGLLCLFYRTRERPLRRYLEQTPPWILELQRSGMSL